MLELVTARLVLVSAELLIKAANVVVRRRVWLVPLVVTALVLGVVGVPDTTPSRYFETVAQIIPLLFIAGIVESELRTGGVNRLGMLQIGLVVVISEVSALAGIALEPQGRTNAFLFWVTTLATFVFIFFGVRRPVIEGQGALEDQIEELKKQVSGLQSRRAEDGGEPPVSHAG